MGDTLSKMSQVHVRKTRKVKHTRAIMRESNRFAVDRLLELGFDDIWLKAHTAWSDYVYSPSSNYYAKDLWNIWDGACWKNGELFFLALKTNNWDSDKKLKHWMSTHKNCHAIAINIRTKNTEKVMDLRMYDSV